jgi:hypothetical protein
MYTGKALTQTLSGGSFAEVVDRRGDDDSLSGAVNCETTDFNVMFPSDVFDQTTHAL